MKLTVYILRMISIFSILYFIAITVISGIKTSFLPFWIFASIISFIISIIIPRLVLSEHLLYRNLGRLIIGCFWVGILFFFLLESVIIYYGKKIPQKDAEYAIVLGAQVRGQTPSKTLYLRIKTAASYLQENPNTRVICSGGQGSGEDISEALAIREGLITLGIDEARIILEDKSTSTVENLTNSMKIINDKDVDVVIVTSDFHCFRSVKLARKLGLTNVSSTSSPEFLVTTMQYYVREFFAIIKDSIYGNI